MTPSHLHHLHTHHSARHLQTRPLRCTRTSGGSLLQGKRSHMPLLLNAFCTHSSSHCVHASLAIEPVTRSACIATATFGSPRGRALMLCEYQSLTALPQSWSARLHQKPRACTHAHTLSHSLDFSQLETKMSKIVCRWPRTPE